MLRVISLGAGVQSVTLAWMAQRGDIAPVDCAIFADTGDEKRATYRYLDFLEQEVSFPIIRVRRVDESLSESTLNHYAGTGGNPWTPPFFFPGGMLPKHCSKEWKTRAVIAELRRQFGLVSRQRGPKEKAAEVLIGISRDEAHRMKPSEVPWIQNAWPLIDKSMKRSHCIQYLEQRQIPRPPRSACVYCPFQSDAEFEEMKDNPADDDWSRVVAFDEGIRQGGNGTTGPLFVSVHRKPIKDVEFGRQGEMWGNECEGMCGV